TISPDPHTPSNPLPSAQAPSEQAKPHASEPNGLPQPSIKQLARVEPPPYELGTLRGPLDEATQPFRRCVERCRKADYRNAVEDLRAARKLDSDAAHVSFFLGVSQLMLGHLDAAI